MPSSTTSLARLVRREPRRAVRGASLRKVQGSLAGAAEWPRTSRSRSLPRGGALVRGRLPGSMDVRRVELATALHSDAPPASARSVEGCEVRRSETSKGSPNRPPTRQPGRRGATASCGRNGARERLIMRRRTQIRCAARTVPLSDREFGRAPPVSSDPVRFPAESGVVRLNSTPRRPSWPNSLSE
jgi:hypothetical protein